jgi:signal peptidase
MTAVCAAALVFVLAVIVVPALLSLQRFVITGGSMTGTIPRGAVIYSRLTPVGLLKAGDIITFTPPGSSTAVTHRIVAVEPGPGGRPAFRTKGDFNEVADPWNPVTLNESLQARYAFQVPLLGYVLAGLSMRAVRMALIGLPAVVMALSLLWSLWREAGEEVTRQIANDRVPHDARSRA